MILLVPLLEQPYRGVHVAALVEDARGKRELGRKVARQATAAAMLNLVRVVVIVIRFVVVIVIKAIRAGAVAIQVVSDGQDQRVASPAGSAAPSLSRRPLTHAEAEHALPVATRASGARPRGAAVVVTVEG